MAQGNVNISLGSGNLGSVLATQDGIAGFELTGASNGSVVTGTPFGPVTSLADAVAYGLTLASNPFAYKVVKEFYETTEAMGKLRAQLYLLVVPNTVTVANMADSSNANSAKKLLDYAGGKIRLLGLMYDAAVDGALTTTAGMDSLVYTAASSAQAMATSYAAAQKPFRFIIGATAVGHSAGTPAALNVANLTDMTGSTHTRGGIFIGDTDALGDAALGIPIGRLAANPVQRKMGRVRDGALVPTAMYIGTTDVSQFTGQDTLHDKAFMYVRTFPNKNGYYLGKDQTCTATTSDYHLLARGRVIDKAQIIAYAYFADSLEDEVPVIEGGFIEPGFAATLEAGIIQAINLTMVANKECQAVACTIDKAWNVTSTDKVKGVLRVRPVGYSSDIDIDLGFML